MQKFTVNGQSVPMTEWKQTDGLTDGRTDGGHLSDTTTACHVGPSMLLSSILLAANIRRRCYAAMALARWHRLSHSSLAYSTYAGWARSSDTTFYRASSSSRGICHGRVSVCLSVSVCLCLSVCLSVTSRCSTKMAKRRNTQTAPHDSPGTCLLYTSDAADE